MKLNPFLYNILKKLQRLHVELQRTNGREDVIRQTTDVVVMQTTHVDVQWNGAQSN
jgi:hypothetical protein